ncbi:hypothetical protein [Sandaracinus amylolyticus]|uniref:hypothetical protein n=1 Tax=Sandaracinus amylolyticus TaxID=927083 RepID=UPI001F27560B|nr:hypothetical protein [Sandaracinus amylolyticus]UJR86435.1 Hypothetical protein I5071_85300 [Sandaracinus amylolyticus]
MRATFLIGILVFVSGCECGRDEEEDRDRASRAESAGGHALEDPARGVAERMGEGGGDVPPPSRFELVDPALGRSTTRARGWASLEDLRAGRGAARMSLGNWLCRLWTHYGPPPEVQRDGFVYVLRDRDTGHVLSAYSAGSGPAVGAQLIDEQGAPLASDAQERVAASVNAFVAMIDATEPQPCELELETDLGRIRVGVRDGEWFEDELE